MVRKLHPLDRAGPAGLLLLLALSLAAVVGAHPAVVTARPGAVRTTMASDAVALSAGTAAGFGRRLTAFRDDAVDATARAGAIVRRGVEAWLGQTLLAPATAAVRSSALSASAVLSGSALQRLAPVQEDTSCAGYATSIMSIAKYTPAVLAP